MEQKVRPPLHLPGLHHASEKQQKEKEHPQDAGREGKGQQTADPHRQKVEGKKQGKLTQSAHGLPRLSPQSRRRPGR